VIRKCQNHRTSSLLNIFFSQIYLDDT